MRHLLVLPLLALNLQAEESLPARLQKLQRLSVEALQKLQGELALAEVPAEARVYQEAHLAYQLSARLQRKDPKGAQALVDRAIQLLEPRKDAESLALLGACMGVKIRFSPASGMTLGPKAEGLFAAALKQAPNNPRVLMLQGIHILHTPAFFGGGAKHALPVLEAAVKAASAAAAPKDVWAPAWGRVETLAWLAQAQLETGQKEAAQANLKEALSLDPDFGFAKLLAEGKAR